jgi:phosphatidylserine decarboxylase
LGAGGHTRETVTLRPQTLPSGGTLSEGSPETSGAGIDDRRGARERLLVRLLRWAPKRAFSTTVGYLARTPLPRFARRPVFTAFARRVGADLGEVENPLDSYGSLDSFFVRKLRPGMRPVAKDPDTVVSPCDGTIAESGIAAAGHLIQAKGIDYKLANLIPDVDAAARFEGGAYLTIYLAPRDYHRVHFPADGNVNGFQHIPGALFPVNAVAVRNIGGLFTLNERLVTFVDTSFGEMAVVMVAATGVGHMTVSYDAVEAHTPGKGRPGPRVRFGSPRRVERGEDLGAFHLGSTVVLLFEPHRIKLAELALGQRVRMGEPIARRATRAGHGRTQP